MVKTGRRIALMLLLCIALTGAKCGDNEAGISKAIRATDDLRAGIAAAEQLTTQLGQDKHITPAQEKQINLLLLGVNSATKIFYAEVVKAREAGQWNADIKSHLAGTFAAVNVELQKLNTAGIFDTNNSDSKQKLELVLKTMNAAAALVQVSLQ